MGMHERIRLLVDGRGNLIDLLADVAFRIRPIGGEAHTQIDGRLFRALEGRLVELVLVAFGYDDDGFLILARRRLGRGGSASVFFLLGRRLVVSAAGNDPDQSKERKDGNQLFHHTPRG